MKRLFLTLALIAGFAGSAFVLAAAQIHIRIGPPAPRYERVPPPRRGYTWQAGYWNWSGGRWVWIGGTWTASRPGCTWIPAHWSNGYWREGHWRC